MKGKIRNIYPGGNTPKGFYSYYNYILPQRKAEKFFCIKGGPGTGKSTLMKGVAEHFMEKGEAVDLLWCSSDPDSLDGVLLKNRNASIVDGTAPHIVDPKNPGAVDEIINLGEFWEEKGIRQHRREILDCNETIGEIFENVYGYLRCAEARYAFMERLLQKLMTPQEKSEMYYVMNMMVDNVSAVKRAESKNMRDMAMGAGIRAGQVKKAFAGALTPAGIKNEIGSIMDDAERIIIVDVPVGFAAGKLLAAVSERLIRAGLDVEEYYCPMAPEKGPEHILCPTASFAVTTCNTFHDARKALSGKKTMELKVSPEGKGKSLQNELLKELQDSSRRDIFKALELLKKAKAYHDELEGYYVPYMDFSKIAKIKDEIIEKVEEIVVE